jgi:hypothetical protein
MILQYYRFCHKRGHRLQSSDLTRLRNAPLTIQKSRKRDVFAQYLEDVVSGVSSLTYLPLAGPYRFTL